MEKEIFISDKILNYIEKRWLTKQYEKVENFLREWNFRQVSLKIREPKKNKIYYIRNNKQFRLWDKVDLNKILIFDIYNH